MMPVGIEADAIVVAVVSFYYEKKLDSMMIVTKQIVVHVTKPFAVENPVVHHCLLLGYFLVLVAKLLMMEIRTL